MSALGLFKTGGRLYIREEYTLMYARLKTAFAAQGPPNYGVVITGQPGIGA
jgi:hypothetical protein